jgi:hypothetical protein
VLTRRQPLIGHAVPAFVLAALFFGLAHFYQGLAGILAITIAGLAHPSDFSSRANPKRPDRLMACQSLAGTQQDLGPVNTPGMEGVASENRLSRGGGRRLWWFQGEDDNEG